MGTGSISIGVTMVIREGVKDLIQSQPCTPNTPILVRQQQNSSTDPQSPWRNLEMFFFLFLWQGNEMEEVVVGKAIRKNEKNSCGEEFWEIRKTTAPLLFPL